MEKSFWDEIWSKNEIGFHMDSVNPALEKFGQKLIQEKKKNAFLPMCGKTLDLLWFSERVENVYGVELSEKAVIEFYKENHIEFTVREEDGFKIYKGHNITIYCGDFFRFPLSKLNIEIVFDRGSLVALPLHMREDYYQKFNKELPSNSLWLLCVFDYPQEKLEGPPFSILSQELSSNLVENFKRELLQEQPFEGFGIEDFKEKVYLLRN